MNLNFFFISLVFNVGEYRRRAVGSDKLHDFFRVDNAEAQKIRRFAVMFQNSIIVLSLLFGGTCMFSGHMITCSLAAGQFINFSD